MQSVYSSSPFVESKIDILIASIAKLATNLEAAQSDQSSTNHYNGDKMTSQDKDQDLLYRTREGDSSTREANSSTKEDNSSTRENNSSAREANSSKATKGGMWLVPDADMVIVLILHVVQHEIKNVIYVEE